MQGIVTPHQSGDNIALDRDAVRNDLILKDRLGLMFAAIPLSQLLAIILAYVLYLVHTNHSSPEHANLWLSVAAVTFSLRGALGYVYRFAPNLFKTSSSWLTLYRVATAVAGLVWGFTGFVFFPADDHTLQMFTLLALAGVCSGALSTSAADSLSYTTFAALVLGPCIAVALFGEAGIQQSLGLLTGTSLFLFIKTGGVFARTVCDSPTLRYENADLVTQLKQEKTQVIKDSETMVSTILACAPIGIWTTNNDGVLCLIDGKQLPLDPESPRPCVGDNFFDFFSDNSQIGRDTRKALAGKSFQTEHESSEVTYEMHYSPFVDDGGNQRGMIGVAIDISERKKHENELSHRADYDQLTGLSNRNLVMAQTEQAFKLAGRDRSLVAIYFLDIDNFKTINDTMGHRAGDELLCQVATRLKQALRDSDIAARLGGDEFLVVAQNLKSVKSAETVANKITQIFNSPFKIGTREIFVTTSIGIALYPDDGDSAAKLLQSADTAMYHAKDRGKSNYSFFTKAMQDTVQRHLEIETELRKALDKNEMTLVYQPKLELSSNQIKGAEVLLRWTSEKLGPVSPAEFVPIAEIAGLMPSLGNWVLEQACTEAASWKHLSETPVHVAINISPQQFRATDLVEKVRQSLKKTGLSAELLELEITESLLVQDAPETLTVFDDLVNMNISLALDDFGTGYSSLSYLKKFPMQVLKIDRTFINDLGTDRETESLVEAIIGMAKSLKLELVAEGVETETQLAYLKDKGVNLIQGYYFSPPVPSEAFRKMLSEQSAKTEAEDALVQFI